MPSHHRPEPAQRAAAPRPRRGHPHSQGRCKTCNEFPVEGTKLRAGICKRCRGDAELKLCTTCNKPPLPGQRLYDGVCRECRAKVRISRAVASVVTPAAGPDTLADARQLAAPAIVSFEVSELRKRVAHVEERNRRLTVRLAFIQMRLGAILRHFQALDEAFKRELSEGAPEEASS